MAATSSTLTAAGRRRFSFSQWLRAMLRTETLSRSRKAAAVRVGPGEVSAQQPDHRVLGQFVSPRLVPQDGPNVTPDG